MKKIRSVMVLMHLLALGAFCPLKESYAKIGWKWY